MLACRQMCVQAMQGKAHSLQKQHCSSWLCTVKLPLQRGSRMQVFSQHSLGCEKL